jgi:hypothetical protein
MLRALPYVLAVVAICALTVIEGVISDRWTDVNREATYAAALLDEIPNTIGDWVGQDELVDDDTQRVAGAEGFVSRTYVNSKTDQRVGVWLIVGHARDTAEHTPDVCYPASGFNLRDAKEAFPIAIEGQPAMKLWTGMFVAERGPAKVSQRVFWTWLRPTTESSKGWEAPGGNPRWYYGSARALYKMYFTTYAKEPTEAADQSPAVAFAKEFMPVVNPIIAKANVGAPAEFDAAAAHAAILKKQADTKSELTKKLKEASGG